MNVNELVNKIIDEAVIPHMESLEGFDRSLYVEEYTDQINTKDAGSLLMYLKFTKHFDLAREVLQFLN